MSFIQQDFEKYYESIFGSRWLDIRPTLMNKEKQVRKYNSFSKEISLTDEISWLPHCAWHEPESNIPRDESELLTYYVLDPASVLVAENLNVKPGEKVLDLCAAPGGKSYVLAQSLFAQANTQSELILNELSNDRRDRLKKVVQQYIPRLVRDQVWIKGKDGVRYGLDSPNTFDAILLDAPCSGERHILENENELKQWKIQRTKGLAQKQYALLCSAWLALKPGGRIMYSTCALSPLENDGVIERFFKKKDGVALLKIEKRGPGFEETQFGVIYMPDRSGFGPMYSCLLTKQS